jgi:hypothetical protein
VHSLTLEQKEVVKEVPKRPNPLTAAKSNEFKTERSIALFWLVGLYNLVFDCVLGDLHDTVVKQEITPDDLTNTSFLCATAVDFYNKEEHYVIRMSRFIHNLTKEDLAETITKNRDKSDRTIITNAHGMTLYLAIMEWKNKFGAGGCDSATQASFSFRNYLIQDQARDAAIFTDGSSYIALGGARSRQPRHVQSFLTSAGRDRFFSTVLTVFAVTCPALTVLTVFAVTCPALTVLTVLTLANPTGTLEPTLPLTLWPCTRRLAMPWLVHFNINQSGCPPFPTQTAGALVASLSHLSAPISLPLLAIACILPTVISSSSPPQLNR